MKQSFRAILPEALARNAREDRRIVVLNADSAKATNTVKFAEEFPDRMICVGISEADLLSTAAGMAAAGMVPVVVGFAMFVTEKPFEQIRQSIAYPRLNVKIVATHAGLCVGKDGASHQALEDIAVMRALPNMSVLAAADVQEAGSALDAMLRHDGPVYLRLGRDLAEDIYSAGKPVALGGSDLLADGNDVAIAATGLMVEPALRAATLLAERGIAASVTNFYSLKPLDTAALRERAARCGAVVTAEDHSVVGGLGGAVAEELARSRPTPVEFVGVGDCFGESGAQDDLYGKYGLTAEAIAAAAVRAVERKHKGN